jgi:hypothetical protein
VTVVGRARGKSVTPAVGTEGSLAAVAAAVERTIREVAPGLRRAVKYGALTYQRRGDVITVGVWTGFVAVGFWNGAKLAARHPILEGTAPSSRVVKMRTPAEATTPEFRRLVQEAVRLDRRDPVHPKKA